MIEEKLPYSVAGIWGSEKKKKKIAAAPKTSLLENSATRDHTYAKKVIHRDESSLSFDNGGNKEYNQGSTARTMNEWLEFQSPTSMRRTQSRLIREPDALVAIGRSGKRIERGTLTSGLIGERLSVAAEPSKNSLVQRSWMYNDDAALMYRVRGEGIPEEPILSAGPYSLSESTGISHWNHGRRAVLTGDVLTKAGTLRAGVFLDDNDYKTEQQR